MKNLFNSVKLNKPNKNLFDLTHDVKFSGNPGELIPIMCMDCVPGDRVSISGESLIRFAPLVSPVMHRLDVYMHYFFVPSRILWDNWENFITNTKVGDYVPGFPYVNMVSEKYTRLCDYLGIPTPLGDNKEKLNALPLYAYQKIYQEYYRDQNLIDDVLCKAVDGDNTELDIYSLRKRAWEHDYFTACLPWAQKGEAVDLPLGKVQLDVTKIGTPQLMKAKNDFNTLTGGALVADVVQPGELMTGNWNTGPYVDSVLDPNGTLEVEPTTINTLRRAFKLQEWVERNARAGTRYVENILAHFGIHSSDKRLQRPEYITGSKSPVVISEVLNTSATETAPQGNMSGHGISVVSGNSGRYFCEEHGFIIGIMSVMPKTAYQQGVHKMWLKYDDSTQYYWPSFANIGEQEVQRREVKGFIGDDEGSQTFGYVPRYAEYKYLPSRVAGDFRSSLNFWHMGRIFEDAPVLNQEFIECNPTNRVYAVTDPAVHKLYCHVLNKVKAVRPMPKFGTPQF